MTLPLDHITVVDMSRMLPGAVLARQLLDLGARVIKVEEPGIGDPMRSLPPLVDGVGAGFAWFLAGAESVALDLADRGDAAVVRRLARRADVVVESYRPGTVERWDLGEDRLRAANPGLVWCALSSFGRDGGDRIGHDLNFVAASGALEMLGGDIPGLQLADVGAGLLAASAILAALLERGRTGRGRRIDQPLAGGVAPFMAWAWVEDAAGVGAERPVQALLNGGCPAYRLYACGDGEQLAVAALEPKLWLTLVNALGLPELAGAGLDVGADGQAAAVRLATRFAERPRDAWLADPAFAGLPVSPVHGVTAARGEPTLELAGVFRDGRPAPWIQIFAPSAGGRAPQLGAATEAIRAEVGGDRE